MSRVEEEGSCDEPHGDTDQDPRIYSVALRAWHRPNENKMSDRCRERRTDRSERVRARKT